MFTLRSLFALFTLLADHFAQVHSASVRISNDQFTIRIDLRGKNSLAVLTGLTGRSILAVSADHLSKCFARTVRIGNDKFALFVDCRRRNTFRIGTAGKTNRQSHDTEKYQRDCHQLHQQTLCPLKHFSFSFLIFLVFRFFSYCPSDDISSVSYRRTSLLLFRIPVSDPIFSVKSKPHLQY